MSEAALQLLESDDSDTPTKSASQRAMDLLEGKAKVPATVRSKPSLLMAPVGGAEMALRAATSVPAGIAGGIAYGGAALGRAIGLDMDPRQAMANVSEYLTYDPVSESGQAGEETLGTAMGAVAAPVIRKADELATEVGSVSPTAETFLREAPSAAMAAGGVLGLSPLASPALSVVKAAPKAVVRGAKSVASGTATAGRKIAAAGEATSDSVVRALGGSPRQPITPETSVNPFERESLGAAAAVPSRLKEASPELQAAVRNEARAGGVDREALDRHLEADSLPIRMQLTEGQATQDPVLISDEMNRRGKDVEFAQRYNEQNQQLIDNLDEVRRESSPGAVGNDHVQNGQQLIDSYKAVDEAASAEINAAYKAARDANGGDLPMDGEAFTRAADAALKKGMKSRYLPSEIAADLTEIRETGAMNFETFENMRTNLAAEARKAERSGDGNAAHAIRLVRDALENTEPVGKAAEVKPLFDKARNLAKARFDRLRADPAYKAAVEDDVAAGEASALADDFVHKYVIRGKVSNVDRMRESLASDPAAVETIKAGALNYLKSKSGVNMYTNEGNFSQAGYNKALAELEPKLETLIGPDAADQVRTIGNVARYVQAQPRGSFVNNSNTTVAQHAANLAKGAAERGVNAILPGADLGTLAREKLATRADKKSARESLKPGAGIAMKPKATTP